MLEGAWYASPVILRIPALLTGAFLLVCLTGCQSTRPPAVSAQAEQSSLASEREQMELIPPPSKNRFMSVRSLDSWQNPYVIVQAGMLELHVTLGDSNPSTFGAGGMLRPPGARRQELNVSLAKLSEAITSIPQSAWPYGRVVAIAEASKTPPAALPAVRRNLEAAVGALSDLGVIAYDPGEGNLR